MPSLFHPCVALFTGGEHGSTVELEDCVLETMTGSANFTVRLDLCLLLCFSLPC
jgi:hypothetical protein